MTKVNSIFVFTATFLVAVALAAGYTKASDPEAAHVEAADTEAAHTAPNALALTECSQEYQTFKGRIKNNDKCFQGFEMTGVDVLESGHVFCRSGNELINFISLRSNNIGLDFGLFGDQVNFHCGGKKTEVHIVKTATGLTCKETDETDEKTKEVKKIFTCETNVEIDFQDPPRHNPKKRTDKRPRYKYEGPLFGEGTHENPEASSSNSRGRGEGRNSANNDLFSETDEPGNVSVEDSHKEGDAAAAAAPAAADPAAAAPAAAPSAGNQNEKQETSTGAHGPTVQSSEGEQQGGHQDDASDKSQNGGQEGGGQPAPAADSGSDLDEV